MANTVAAPAVPAKRKMLQARFADRDRKAAAGQPSLSGLGSLSPDVLDEFKRRLGLAIEHALEAAGISKQDAAYRMGYGSNQATVTNWIKGLETPQFAKLWTLGERFQRELVIALAELSGTIRIDTVLTIRREAVNA